MSLSEWLDYYHEVTYGKQVVNNSDFIGRLSTAVTSLEDLLYQLYYWKIVYNSDIIGRLSIAVTL